MSGFVQGSVGLQEWVIIESSSIGHFPTIGLKEKEVGMFPRTLINNTSLFPRLSGTILRRFVSKRDSIM